jgi:hypothetical protein
MHEDTVDKMEDEVREPLPVVKMERNASSVNDMPREAPEVSKVVSLMARGIASALARSADRPMLRSKQATRREKDIGKDSTRRGNGRRLNEGANKKKGASACSTQAKAY